MSTNHRQEMGEGARGPLPFDALFLVGILGAFAIAAALFAYYARSNYDETLFLYASNLVYDGKVPYRDFPFIFGPVLPYVYGIPQALLGPSLLVGRMTSVFLSVVTVGAGAYIAHRFSGRLGALVFVALIALNPLVLWVFTVPKTESLVTPLVMVALAVWISHPRQRGALLVAASLLLWAAAVRQTAFLAFLGLTPLIFFQLRRSRHDTALVAGALTIQAVALFGIPALLARGNMFFHMVEAQWTYRAPQALGDRFQDVIDYYPEKMLENFAVVLVPVALAAVLLLGRWRRGWRPDLGALDSDASSAQVLLLLTAALIFAPHLGLSLPWIGYFVVSAAILAVLVGVSSKALAEAFALGLGRLGGPLVLIGIVAAGGLTFGLNRADYVPRGDVEAFRDGAAYVRSRVSPDQQVVTFQPAFGLVRGLPLPPELTMGFFSYWEGFLSTERAEDLNLVQWESLNLLFTDPQTRLVILNDAHVAFFVLIGSRHSTFVAQNPVDVLGPTDGLTVVESKYLHDFPGLSEGGYRLDRQFEEEFSDRLPGTHAFVR